MKRIVVSSIIAFAIGLSCHANAQYAGAVINYTPGTLLNTDYSTGNPFDVATSVLGAPQAITGSGLYDEVYSPFDPPWTAMTGVGYGGTLTLQLQNYVTVSAGQEEIGVWSNVGIEDVSPDYVGTAGAPATTLEPPNSAVVSVSANGTDWVTLNGGSPITFGLPGNYYLNAGPYDSSAPASPQLANFGQPFTGTLSSFDGEDYSQILTTLGGSAGGTWLDLDGTGLSQVGYIEFQNVTPGTELDLSTVSINSSLAGSPIGAVPEPGTLGMIVLGATALVAGFKQRR